MGERQQLSTLTSDILCPALDASCCWDDLGHLRGELLAREPLSAHASELAKAHGEPVLEGGPSPLRRRIAQSRARLRQAYGILARRSRDRRELSPAEERLLGDASSIQSQNEELRRALPRGYLRKLPRLSRGAMRGFPRVYAVCLDYLRHTDGRLEEDTLVAFLESYQSVRRLTSGELWAVPGLLRLGLVMRIGALMASESSERSREEAHGWAERVRASAAHPAQAASVLRDLDRSDAARSSAFLVRLSKRLREHDGPLELTREWIAARCFAMGATPEELTRREHLSQAADQVSIGNAVGSLRELSALSWEKLFERTSAVEPILAADPSGAYRLCDRSTRDRYRRAVADLARRSRKDEVEVARAAIAASRRHLDAPASQRGPASQPATESTAFARGHVGYFLIDDGRAELEHRIGYRPTLGMTLTRALASQPATFYFSAFGALVLVLLGLVAEVLEGAAVAPLGRILLLLLTCLPASEIALSVVNALSFMLLPPRRLAKLDFSSGIPEEQRTLVVVSALLDGPDTIDRLIDDLRVRSLANPDPSMHFALLTDFTDAPTAVVAGDAALVERAREGIIALNAQAGAGADRFWLLHRRRVRSHSEGCFMGWERKRGKLEELNRLLRGDVSTTFSSVLAPRARFAAIRNVITLAVDTVLPRDVAAELVGAIAHPLNQPEVEPGLRRVVRGHGIIQPRVGSLAHRDRRTRFAAAWTNPSGIDPIASALSDTYQDVFGEGSFVGKGIYDVDAFQASLDGRVPEARMLSHELFEGIYARSALATDIEIFEEPPASYVQQTERVHRCMRGDWQLLPWLLPKVPTEDGLRQNDLRFIDCWKILDNLRRALLAPSLIALAVAGWFAPPQVAAATAAMLVGVFVVPLIARSLLALRRGAASPARPSVGSLGGDLRTSSTQALLNLIFALDLAWVSVDACLRSLYRLLLSKRQLLHWRGTGSPVPDPASVPVRLWLSGGLSLLGLAMVVASAPDTWAFAMPLLLAWTGAPLLAAWLSLPIEPRRPAPFSDADRSLLLELAQKTWRFFDELVTEADNHLPPESLQEEPRGTVVHRTSPTNVGVYLLGVVSARDLGFITSRETRERLGRSLTTLEKLEKREGHLLRSYETTSLRPVEPRYVSSVESGNLCAYLWTLRQACLDLADEPFLSARTLEAVCDALRLAQGTKDVRAAERRARALLESSPRQLVRAASDLRGELGELGTHPDQMAANRESTYWLSRAELHLADAIDEVMLLAPWLSTPAPSSRLEAVPELADALAQLWERLDALSTPHLVESGHVEILALLADLGVMVGAAPMSPELRGECELEVDSLSRMFESGAEACIDLCTGLARIGERALAIADGMSFRLLFDERRELFATGYDVGNSRLDGTHHDLLASESRLCSFVCIAKGDVAQSHWQRLGRPRARIPGGPALLSWNGSMVEYLLPLLCLENDEGTLLDQAYRAALARQRQYAAEQGVPWGISDSAHNVMDVRMAYGYRAFGVPGLGLRAGIGDELVIAPHATLLGGLVRPDWLCKNLRALQKEGLDGTYGLYEAIDYTPEHVPPGRRGVVVKAFMGHHQGMSLVALDNLLLGAPMQQRFHRDPRVKATALLLEERIPVGAAPPRAPAAMLPRAAAAEPRSEAVDHVGLASTGPLRVQLLCHGALSSLVSATGAGVTTWKGIDVNRFREDPVLEAGGIYLYIKNRTHNQLWSAAHQPTLADPSFYNVAFSIDRVEFHRKDGDVQTLTEVALSPEHPVELRRVTLTNQGESPLELELTSYTEVVLAPRGADVGQRAFSNMFVETEALPERYALLARRRPRNPGESASWLVQMLVAESGTFGPLDYDCSRLRFLGRGKSTAEPEALAGDAPLAKQAGLMLDTALALRRNIRLAPGATAQLTLATGLAPTREEAIGLIDAYSAKHAVPRAIELGWAGVRVQLGHLGITPTELHRFQRLLSAVVFPHATLRHGARPSMTPARGLSALWAQGISGDLPVLLCRIDDADFTELCRDLLLAHELWRLNGFQSDLVFLDETPGGQGLSVADALRDLNRGDALMDQRGGVFLRRAEQLDEEQRELLFGVARVVLRAREGSLARQLRRVLDVRPVPPLFMASGSQERAPAHDVGFQRPKLTYDNGVGGFGADGREYIMVLEPGVRSPSPWCNVIANPDFGTLVSEVGSSFTWSRNSQRHRLTPWNNDAVSDPSGELLYVRDDDDGSFWSATPEPLGRGARYLVRHGQGYSQFEHERAGLSFELTLFVSPDEALKFSRLRLENRGQEARRLSVFACVEWVLGNNRESSRVAVSTSYDATNDILFAANPIGLFPTRRAFLASTRPTTSVSGDRAEFFGVSGSRSAPEALTRVGLSGHVGAGLDAAGALHVELEIRPGETLDLAILLGEAGSNEEAQSLCAKYRQDGAVNDALARARKTWVDLLGAVRIKTPDRALDLMQNNWLLYQSLSSRVWGRTGFFQSSGAYGYRDQLQDVLASVHARPSIAREHLLRAASRQFLEGDVQHWWHDETGHGLRTRCSDDMLWLPFVTAEYVRMTGDRAVLDEQVAFLHERPLRDDEQELYTAPPASDERASLYEHCKRALDVGLTRGEHGLPLMRAGDWNDGMNRVGIEGRGESVWLAWFLVKTLTEFAQVARLMGDVAREESSIAEAKRIAKAVDQHAWDGQWYRRASFDDGTWLGSRENGECSIDAIAQSWAVIAGQGDPERASLAVAASEARLIVPALRMMKLLDPAFEKTRPDPGYIQSYPAGIRENGGQYTHGVLWTVLALTLLGAGDRAGELLALLNPIRHADTPDGIQRYRAEPYVVAADVYGGSGYEGRGGWTWYTGSAGWMYRIGLEYVIGLRRRGRTLAITPCVPSSWPSFEVEYRYGTATYHIVVDNPDRVSHGVARLELDGRRVSESYIRLESDDHVHEVRVVLGRTQSSRAARASSQP